MTGDGIDTEVAFTVLGVSVALCIWAALVLWAQARMRQEKRLRKHAERVVRELGIDQHMYGILVDRRRARTSINWFEGGDFRSITHQWSNRFEDRTRVSEWYNRGTEDDMEETR